VEFDTLSHAVINNTIKKVFGDGLESFNQVLMDDFVNLNEQDLTDLFSTRLLKEKRGL
jgi:hypothetical protein